MMPVIEVLAGGPGAEAAVSAQSGDAVVAWLQAAGADVRLVNMHDSVTGRALWRGGGERRAFFW